MELTNFKNTTLENIDINIIYAIDNNIWLNATDIAKQFDKQMTNYWNSKDTIEYIEALYSFNSLKSNELKKAVVGKYGGTYIHPDLIIHFARWVNPRFAVACDIWIKQELIRQKEKIIEQQQKIIERQQKHNLITYADGAESLKKIIRTYYPDVLGEREAWRYLVKKGIVAYEPKTTYIKTLKDNKYGRQVQDSIIWNDRIYEILDELADEKENKLNQKEI